MVVCVLMALRRDVWGCDEPGRDALARLRGCI